MEIPVGTWIEVQAGAGTQQGAAGPKPRLLVVGVRPAFVDRLDRTRFEVGECEVGALAVRRSDSIAPAPHAVLVDASAPASIAEIFGHLRTIPHLAGCPVLVYSSRDDCDALERGLRLGAIDCVDFALGSELALRRLERNLEHALRVRRSVEIEERLSLVASAACDALWDWDLTRDVIWYSPRWSVLLGLEAGAMGTDPSAWLDRVHPDDADDVQAALLRCLEGKTEQLSADLRIMRGDGHYGYFLLRGAPLRRANGRAYRIAGALTDRTEAKQIRDMKLAMKRGEDYYRSLIEKALDIITTIDGDGTITYESPSVERVLGFNPKDLVGARIFDFMHPEDAPLLAQAIEQGTRTPAATPSLELRFKHRDGSWRMAESLCSYLLDDNGVRGLILNSRDITERKQFEERLKQAAFHDALTGLSNRAHFSERLRLAIDRAARDPGFCFAVMLMDLDRFKRINDSLGHVAGDEVLVAIARQLEGIFRRTDLVARPVSEGRGEDGDPSGNAETIARLGGDEFIVLVEGIKDQRGLRSLAERVIRIFNKPFVLNGQEVFAHASIGIAVSTTGYRTPEEVVRDADSAMYRAKADGRGRYEFFDSSMHSNAMALLKLEAELRRAVEREEFVLYYQPLVEVKTRKLIGFEALLRWNHPERGIVPPAEFISMAEDTGLIVPMGQWVLRSICAQHRAWLRMGFSDLRIAMNFSVRQFQQEQLSKTIADTLHEMEMDPANLELELTESLLVGTDSSTLNSFRELRALGVRIGIDDFGTGYSSLSYLKRLQITTVKIDRSFVRDITHDPDAAAIVAGIIALAHTLKLEVVAEGIETEQQLETLRQQSCEVMQGFLFSPPVPVSEATSLLERHHRRS